MKNNENYTLKDIISASRNITNKIRSIEYKLIFLTGLVICDGEIRLNYRRDSNNKDIYDSYKIDLNGNIISLSGIVIDEHSKAIIDEYKSLLELYFKMYNEIDKKNIYKIKDKDYKIYTDTKCIVLYKETEYFIEVVNPLDMDFYCLYSNGKLKINGNFDINELLQLEVEGKLPKIIINYIKPISMLSTDEPNIYKITDYSNIKEKINNTSKLIKKKLIKHIKN